MRRRSFNPVLAGLALAVAFGGAAVAAPPPLTEEPYKPPVFTYAGGRIGLLEVVRLTLANDPNLLLAHEDVRLQSGVLQEQKGAFDAVLNGDLSYSFKEEQVRQSTIQNEKDKRDQATQSRDNFCQQAIQQDQNVAALQNARTSQPGTIQVPGDLSINTQLTFIDNLIKQATDPKQRQALLNSRLDFINAEITSGQKTAADLHFACTQAGAAVQRLGAIPEFEQTAHGELNISLDKLFRNGITFSPFIESTYDHNQFAGKHNGFRQPLVDEFGNTVKGELGTPVQEFVDFGGTNIEDLYRASVGFEVNLPLLRGRGAASVDAPERAADRDLLGRVLTYKHAAATSVLNAVSAYWQLLAAQQRVEVLQRSTDLQGQIVKITDQLIAGDEVPRAERARALAGEATSRSQLEAAQRDLVSARLDLAKAMGLAVENEQNAPFAQDAFPVAPAPDALGALAPVSLGDMALDRRYDLQAIKAGVDGRLILAVAARLNTRTRFDLDGSVLATAVGEKTLSDAFRHTARPGGSLKATFEKPIRNDTLLGRQLQADAQLAQQRISATDLARTIRLSVVEDLATLAQASDRLRQAEIAAKYSQDTIDGEVQKLQAGESTLVDAILTEQQRTSSLVDLISARQDVAVLLARLRFETGTLVENAGDTKATVSQDDLTTLPSGKAAANGAS